MKEIISKEKCIGCRVCELVCPKDAITFKEEKLGFLFPNINQTKCVNCYICQKSCPEKNMVNKSEENNIYYYGYTNDNNLLLKSSSGGFFGSIARFVLEKNGIVYGATLSEDLQLYHTKIDNENDLNKILGSKYIQSDLRKTFLEVQNVLNIEKLVLFCGTPCQIHALKKYLNAEYSNLVTIDLACSGVPSHALWYKYISSIEKEQDSKIKSVLFREKDTKWDNYSIVYELENRKKISSHHSKDPFFQCYIAKMINRDVCYQCKYKYDNYFSDITIGDFWGVEKFHENYNRLGTSFAIARTKIGKEYIENSALILDKTTFENITDRNWVLIKNKLKHPNRDIVCKEFAKTSDMKLLLSDNFYHISIWKRLKFKFLKLLYEK